MGHHMRQAALVLLGVVAAVAAGCGSDCQLDGDCGAGLECVAGACQPKSVGCVGGMPECASDSECASEWCDDGCCAVACASALDCGDGEVCRSGVCRPAQTGCANDDDCFSPTSRCQVEKAVCVACLTPADCGGPDGVMSCTAENLCVRAAGRCLESRDCDPGKICADTHCKPPPTGCQSDDACGGETPRCKAESGECVACVSNDDCGTDGTSACNLTTNACEAVVPGCGGDDACAAPLPFCRTEDRTCVECKLSEHCGPDATCEANECEPLPGCSSNAQCDEQLSYCRTGDRTCVQCLDTAQCGVGKICTNNICLPANGCDVAEDCPFQLPACRADRTCVQCVGDAGCERDETCKANVCERLPGCSGNEECPAETPVCRDDDRTCVECVETEDCTGGETCVAGVCQCGSDADCGGETPACHSITRACVECSASKPCAPGFRCWAEGVCEPLEDLNIPCAEALDCDREPGLLCVGTTPDDGRCLAECLVYESPSRCPSGTVCSRVGWRGESQVGACVPDTGQAEGEACSATQACRANLECVPESATESKCRATCDLAAPAGCADACRKMVELDADNVPRTYGLCYPKGPKYLDTCDTSAGCQSWQVCARGPERDDATRLTNICRLPAAGQATGIAGCNVDEDCRSGYCVRSNPLNFNGAFAGHCQQSCLTDAECPKANGNLDGACTLTPVDWFDRHGDPIKSPVAACVPQCRGEFDCRVGDTCVAQLNLEGTKWITRCLPAPQPEGGFGGARCTQGADCRSGTCLQNPGNPTDGICLGACANQQDCDPEYGVCDIFGILLPTPGAEGGVAPAKVCWGGGGTSGLEDGQCTSDNDCFTLPSGDKRRVCVERVYTPLPDTTTRYNCMPATGDVPGGGVCAKDLDCASGRCVEWKSTLRANTEKRCLAPCTVHSQCAGAPTSSLCVSVARPNGSPNLALLCMPAYCAEDGANCYEIATP